ncbi:hypothetical protein GGI55_001740 [Rhizobium leguminosarum]|uniref:hypothetical protein n=1 Tax=Rhizobium TaxID=379 RepID=UPI00161769AB|nr:MULTISPECIES: hypothetical protein [Rhizobium]MBB4297213.1 hypothetical protein [Rhizobium leguminosarum]MBB4415361.1 hypothetical protein [Rhizobium leguminosarum]MBB4431672.1 hypothetical protein [Rhizobium esperanzae]MBB4539712.1 hypothetical protein [Rhizobium leguminosarum]MBB5651895.1 hypothetical protein [Rhizobium leguminosarum]
MAKITVYRVKAYDHQLGDYADSLRWWHKEGTPSEGIVFIEESAAEIDESDLITGTPYTAEGYNPPGHQ